MISSFSKKSLLPNVLVTIGTSVTPFVSAKAHIGHVGEVAGHDHSNDHRHHPYPHAKHPHGPKSVRNRQPTSATKAE